MLLELTRHCITKRGGRVAGDVEMPAIMLAKYWQKVSPDHMVAKVRRNKTNAKTTVGTAIVGMTADQRPQRLGVLAVPTAMFFRDGLRVVSRVELQRVYETAVSRGMLGIERDGATIGGDGLVKLAFILERIAEIVVEFRNVGVQRKRALIRCKRLAELSFVVKG